MYSDLTGRFNFFCLKDGKERVVLLFKKPQDILKLGLPTTVVTNRGAAFVSYRISIKFSSNSYD